ncbi:hypothetical protein B0H19DRAFT_1324441 [Mycena capillaripes]|nr:hypothetical protein B0H19DRAFT_1324441 [Mycena capillaripes]
MCLTLCASARVHCIVCLCPTLLEMMQNRVQPLIHDSRFVCIDQQGNRREAWLRGIDDGQDYWALAEDFIMARRAGRVNSFSPEKKRVVLNQLRCPSNRIWDSNVFSPRPVHAITRMYLFAINTVDGSAAEVDTILLDTISSAEMDLHLDQHTSAPTKSKLVCPAACVSTFS